MKNIILLFLIGIFLFMAYRPVEVNDTDDKNKEIKRYKMIKTIINYEPRLRINKNMRGSNE